MNKLILLVLIIFSSYSLTGQSNKKQVKEAIYHFTNSADSSNDKELEEILAKEFRVIMNQLFGSKDVSILDKEGYLSKIRSGEFGGTKRKVVVKDVILNGLSATAFVEIKSEKFQMNSILNLIQDDKGKWRIVSDIPYVPA